MGLGALVHQATGRFFQQEPWFVSPVKVPCAPCAKINPRKRPSLGCENHDSFEYNCAPKAIRESSAIIEFTEHNEPSSIQLFYDLFFVANLSTCTANHNVKDGNTLESYVCFFTLLWFTWFCTIIFDVRFAIDSWFIRLSKAYSFSIMAAFAMSTVFFNAEDGALFGHDRQAISYILMASRMFLVIQYGAIMIAVYYRHPNVSVIKPFALTMGSHLVAAFVFLGLSFQTVAKQPYGNIGWLVNPTPLPTCKDVMLT